MSVRVWALLFLSFFSLFCNQKIKKENVEQKEVSSIAFHVNPLSRNSECYVWAVAHIAFLFLFLFIFLFQLQLDKFRTFAVSVSSVEKRLVPEDLAVSLALQRRAPSQRHARRRQRAAPELLRWSGNYPRGAGHEEKRKKKKRVVMSR